MGIPPSYVFKNPVHPDASGSRSGADDWPDLVVWKARPVSEREQMLLLRFEAADQRM
jgi:hypothetical protein